MSQFQPLASDDPRRLGEYDIIARLGEGGQGIVYLGKSGSGEQVAVKLLHHALVADPDARTRFLREVAVAQRVARFCTATVLHADLEGSRPYIVSEYVPGPSLRELVINEGPRRGAALERLAISTATALAAIHRAGILHRDFKPANVLMGPEGPVVIDFGIARALDSPTATATGMAMGTPSFLAPEQLTGTSAISEAADVFAWGVTMVFAATGKPAFGSDSIPVVMHRILNEEPQLGRMEGALADLVAACLSKDPTQRPTADQLIIELTGQPVPKAAVEPVTGPTTQQPAGPHAFAAPHPTVQQGGTEDKPAAGYTPQATAYGQHSPNAHVGGSGSQVGPAGQEGSGGPGGSGSQGGSKVQFPPWPQAGGQPDAPPQTGPYGQAPAPGGAGPTVVAAPSTFGPGIPQGPGTPPGNAPGMPSAPGMPPGGAPGMGAGQAPGMGAGNGQPGMPGGPPGMPPHDGHPSGAGMPPGAPQQPGAAQGGPQAGPFPGGHGPGPQGHVAHGPGPQGPGGHGGGPQGPAGHGPGSQLPGVHGPGSQQPGGHGPGSQGPGGHGPGGRGPGQPPGGRPDGGAGSKQRRTLTFALSGAAAAALLVVAGAVVVQANSGAQKVLSVGVTSEVSPTILPSAELPVDTSTPDPSSVPDLDVDQPKPTKTRTRPRNDALAQVPDPVAVPSRKPTARPTRSPSPSPTKTTKRPTRKKNQIEPSTEPTGTPTPTIVQNPHQPSVVCGAGYKVIARQPLGDKATVFLLYHPGLAKNCVVTMSRLIYPTKIHMNAILQVKGGASASNPGRFSAYAGPIRLSAPKKCVIWGGTWENLTWKSGWSHCG